GAGYDAIAQRHALLVLELVARLGVDLGDLHALRAHLRADAAARAVVDRRLDRQVGGHTQAPGLGAGVLRSREQRRNVRDRARGLADRALHAVVQRPAQEFL